MRVAAVAVAGLAWPAGSLVPRAAVGVGRRRVGLAVMEEEKAAEERLAFEDTLMEEWSEAWEGEKDKEGFDWEMEKLRRKLEVVPESFGGPKFWRRMIEAEPESFYAAYEGSTYPGSKPGGLDSFRILFNNLLQFLLGNESEDLAPVAGWDWKGALDRCGPGAFGKALVSGDLQGLVGGPLFLLLTKYHRELGPVFKLAFGPRSFIVVCDPAIARYILRDNSVNYDKGILAEILAPVLGKGLIPADPDVWKRRRRVISPAFHKKWLESTLSLFDECTAELVADLRRRCPPGGGGVPPGALPDSVDAWADWKADGAGALGVVDMEERFCSVSLDIIGRAVFDYDFDSTHTESPLVRAVYRCLVEAERRTTAFIPFWLLPGAHLLPSQVAFRRDLDLLEGKLDELVAAAFSEDIGEDEMLDAGAEVADAKKDGEAVDRVSLLRFLVTVRGEEADGRQLRDDLMTMLVAGHETTAALLTWTLYELFHPSGRSSHHLERLRSEVDGNYAARAAEGRGTATAYEDVVACAFARLCLSEGLRLYPQPPLLIRRALDSDELPAPYPSAARVKLARGTDLFLSTWSLHKNPALWDEPETFDPTRFERPRRPGPDAPAGWRGFDPAKIPAQALYPTEQSADYAYLPFGAGGRRCVGDQFAMLEATVMLATLVNEFDFAFALRDPKNNLTPKEGLGCPVADVGMQTGATIHTENGLWMTATPRAPPAHPPPIPPE